LPVTFLDWGCDPLREECESCLNAICNACNEDYRKARREHPDGLDRIGEEPGEPDCDHCELEKKPDCSACGIVRQVCVACARHETCEFRI
jgi:hypothetical protein